MILISSKKVEQNEQLILNELEKRDRMNTEEAAALLKASHSTVRRLFTKLEQQGDVVRTFGGICRNSGTSADYSFIELDSHNQEAKERIAQQASVIIKNGDTIYLDGGTTMARLAAELTTLLRSNELKNINIFTNSIVNLNILKNDCPVSLIGGNYKPNRQDFSGFLAEESIKLLHFSKCFLGSDAFEPKSGFTGTDFDAARLNSLVIASSDFRYMLIDSSKFGKASMVKFADLSHISMIITDTGLDETWRQSVEKLGGTLKLS